MNGEMNWKVGKVYKTEGGWEALVVHVSYRDKTVFVVYNPGTVDESDVIGHAPDGKLYCSVLSPDHCLIYTEDN